MSESSDNDESDVEHEQFKVIILGDGAVGKTSIAMRHTDSHFSDVYKQTIGLDFFLNKLTLPDNMHVALQIWDIGGQTIGGKMLQNYIYGAHAVIFVYDITNYSSFQNLEDWYRLVCRTFQDESEMPYTVLMANKMDLNHMRVVPDDKHRQFADENEMRSALVSAKSGDQINTTLYQLAADLAGVTLTKQELEVSLSIVPAQIVEAHQQNDESIATPDIRSKSGCCVQ